MMKLSPFRAFVLGCAATGVLALIAAPPLALTHRKDLPLERAYAGAMKAVVAKIGAASATSPLGPDARPTDSARAAYTGSCASCHGAKGDGKGAFGLDTYPNAADLNSADVKGRSDGELFWITKNGLGFTGMPAFATQYRDADIWALVVYIRALQRGGAAPVSVPAPTLAQLAFADPFGDAPRRGAAVYFAAGCAGCHGAVGNGPGELALRGRIDAVAVRGGGIGMPTYGTDRISDPALADLVTYVSTFDARGPQR